MNETDLTARAVAHRALDRKLDDLLGQKKTATVTLEVYVKDGVPRMESKIIVAETVR